MSRKKQTHSLKNKIWSTIRVLILGTLFYLGAVLIFLGSGLGSSFLIQQNANQASTGLTVKKADQNKKRKTSYDASKTNSVSSTSILQSKQKKAYAIGRISIPAVNIHNPLFNGYGDQNQNLEYGVVTCLADRTMGGANNYVLAGHYMGQHGPAILDNLHLVKKGDLIYVTDLHNIYVYEINSISFAIKPTQVEVENNIEDKHMITLITCSDFNTSKYGYGEHRTVVQGDLVSKIKATKSNLVSTELANKNNFTKNKKKVILPTKKGHKINKGTPVRSAAKPKFYQRMNFINAVIAGFNIIFLLLIIWQLTHIWVTQKWYVYKR